MKHYAIYIVYNIRLLIHNCHNNIHHNELQNNDYSRLVNKDISAFIIFN